MRLYTVSDIRHIEQEVFRRTPPFTVMRMAGEAMAAEVLRRSPPPSTTLVLVGEGNNGGDGYIAARALHEAGQRVRLIAAAPPKTPDAQKARTLWEECGKTENPESGELPAADGIIDALFGIGLSRPPTGVYRQLIEQANAAATPVWAIDCPSGVCADSGEIFEIAIQAEATLSFFAAKIGLFTGEALNHVGEVIIEPLLPFNLPAAGRVITARPPVPPSRRHRKTAHKGDFGTITAIGGDTGMLGALVLATRAAVAMGAGKVKAHPLAAPPAVDWRHPEIIWDDSLENLIDSTAIIAGMGMGQSERAQSRLQILLGVPRPLLLDADALNLIAAHPTLRQQLTERQPPTVITPHPGEAARLLKTTATAVNADRRQAARTLSETLSVVAVLKGAGTVIHSPSAEYALCAAGNAALARAGSGDILAGIIGTLLAQMSSAYEAAQAGVWCHAAAAESLAQETGYAGLDINRLARRAARLMESPPPPTAP